MSPVSYEQHIGSPNVVTPPKLGRITPSTLRPRRTPWPSTSSLRFTSRLARSVGLGPLCSWPEELLSSPHPWLAMSSPDFSVYRYRADLEPRSLQSRPAFATL